MANLASAGFGAEDDETQQTPDQRVEGAIPAPKLSDVLSRIKSGNPLVDDIDNLSQAIAENKLHLPPQADTSKIDALQERAYDMQDKRASRNEWLQFANTLGNALAKIGMGAAGQASKTDLSGVSSPGEKINFLEDTNQGEASLGHQLQFGNQAREAVLRQNQLANQQAREDWSAKNQGLSEQLRAKTSQLHEQGLENRMNQVEAGRESRLNQVEAGKTARQGNALDLKQNLQDQKLDARTQQVPTRTTNLQQVKQQQNANTLFSLLDQKSNGGQLNYEDLQKDTESKKLAVRAGTTLESAVNAYNSGVGSAPETSKKLFMQRINPTAAKQVTPGVTHQAPPAGYVTMLRPDGTPVGIKQEDIVSAQKAGYTIPGTTK